MNNTTKNCATIDLNETIHTGLLHQGFPSELPMIIWLEQQPGKEKKKYASLIVTIEQLFAQKLRNLSPVKQRAIR
jgi:hypothetical protein